MALTTKKGPFSHTVFSTHRQNSLRLDDNIHWQVLVTANLTILPGPLISLTKPKCLDVKRWKFCANFSDWNLRMVSKLRLPVSLFKWVESLNMNVNMQIFWNTAISRREKLDNTEVLLRWQNEPPLCPLTPVPSKLGTLNILILIK